MKTLNLKTVICKDKYRDKDSLFSSGQGITKGLLEKYKAKGLYNKEGMSNSNNRST